MNSDRLEDSRKQNVSGILDASRGIRDCLFSCTSYANPLPRVFKLQNALCHLAPAVMTLFANLPFNDCFALLSQTIWQCLFSTSSSLSSLLHWERQRESQPSLPVLARCSCCALA